MPAERPILPDQFPTLEAAATLGFAILLWRTVLLARLALAEVRARARHLRGGRARDLVVLAVLLGATLYGVSAGLGPWFVSMCSGGAVLVVVGGALRHRIAARSATVPGRTRGKPSRHASPSGARTPAGRCPRCDAGRLVAVAPGRPVALHAVTGAQDESSTTLTRLSALEVCPRCGYLQGTAEDRRALFASSRLDEEGGQQRP